MITINKTHSLYNSIPFIVKALDKGKDTRPALALAKVADNKLIATDGHRLHCVLLDRGEIPDGLYRIVKAGSDWLLECTSTDMSTYPNTDPLLNNLGEWQERSTRIEVTSREYATAYLGYHIAQTGVCLQHKYIDDIVPFPTLNVEWAAYVRGILDPVILQSGYHLALLMPMRTANSARIVPSPSAPPEPEPARAPRPMRTSSRADAVLAKMGIQ